MTDYESFQSLELRNLTERDIAQIIFKSGYDLAQQIVDDEGLDGLKKEQIIGKLVNWQEQHGHNLAFHYKARDQDPNTRLATITTEGKIIGQVIIKHLPQEKIIFGEEDEISFFDGIKKLLSGKLLKNPDKHDLLENEQLTWFREIYQFINKDSRSLVLEDLDGAIKTEYDIYNPENDGYLLSIPTIRDTIYSPEPFPTTFSALLKKLHEFGHAYRFGLMNQNNREAHFWDTKAHPGGEGYQFDTDSSKNKARMNRIIYEEIVVSSQAIIKMVRLFDFLGINNQSLFNKMVEHYALGLVTYFHKYWELLAEVDPFTDWTTQDVEIDRPIAKIVRRPF